MIKTTLIIQGMSCGMCEAHINDVIRRNFVVKKVASSHKKKRAEIISEQELDAQKLKEVIGATGYAVESISTESYEKKHWFGK